MTTALWLSRPVVQWRPVDHLGTHWLALHNGSHCGYVARMYAGRYVARTLNGRGGTYERTMSDAGKQLVALVLHPKRYP